MGFWLQDASNPKQGWGYEDLKSQQDFIQNNMQQLYKEAKQRYENLYKSNNLQDIVDSVFSQQPNEEHWSTVISAELNEIRQGNVFKFIKSGQGKSKEFNITIAQAIQLKEQWEKIVNYFTNPNTQQIGDQYKSIKKQYDTLKSNIDRLLKQINQFEVQSISLNQVLNEAQNDLSAGNIANALQGTINGLLGTHLEVWYTNRINEIQSTKQVRALNTGSITVGGKKIKEDILLFPIGEIQIGQTILKFNEKGEIIGRNNEPVLNLSLSEAEYLQLLEKAQGGLSVKTSNRNIVFHSGYNFMKISNASSDIAFKQLQAFYRMKKISSVPKSIRPLTWQFYVISKDIDNIIGRKNLFIANGKKIMPTHQYIDILIDKAKYPLHFSPMDITHEEVLKSKKIVGPALG